MLEMNRVIDRIEELLTDDIDIIALSREALTSEYHLRRMFATLAGISLSEYVRHRRLSVATADLLAGAPVLEVAIKYRYASPEAFTRAFRRFHGLNPSDVRRSNARLRSQPRLRFQLIVTGVTNMDYRIVEKPSFYLTGFRTQVPLVHTGPNEAIINFEKSLDPADKAALMELNNTAPAGQLSISTEIEDPTTEGTKLEYWHAVATTQSTDNHRFEQIPVPAGTWVVFETTGPYPEAMQQMWADAATEWFPANPYHWAPGPQLLHVEYSQDYATAQAELWLPITPADGQN